MLPNVNTLKRWANTNLRGEEETDLCNSLHSCRTSAAVNENKDNLVDDLFIHWKNNQYSKILWEPSGGLWYYLQICDRLYEEADDDYYLKVPEFA